MQTVKFLKIAVVLLLIINIATLTYMFYLSDRPTHERIRRPHTMLIERLNMTEDQQEKYEQLRSEYRQELRTLRIEKMKARKQTFLLLQDTQPDTMKAQNLTREAADIQQQMELITFNHFKNIKNFLTEEQKEQFNEFVGEMSERFTRSHRRGRGHRHHSEE
ncbi:Spy/CpxP family protein refolding chaperone [Cytophagaceae bacterium ABcell3]|nr:Spy/CpxP family protein refolding chaperone [Cytophagaceae bacterium ABcell3]